MAGRSGKKGRSKGSPKTCDILVKNGYVLTLDDERRIFAEGAIAVTGNTIAAVGPQREIAQAYDARRVFDAHGAPVHPGFIDAHVHIVHGTCRGVFTNPAASDQEVSFADWKADVTGKDEYAATALASLEMLRNGFTCFVEPGTVFDTDAVAAAAEAVGVRGLLAAPYLWDQVEIMKYLGGLESKSLYDRVPPKLERALEQLAGQLYRNKDPDALVRGYVALYGVGTASDELLLAAKTCADEHGVAFHQHEGYVPAASRADKERLGKSRIAHLAELGVLDANATLIHMNVIYDEDVQPIVDSGLSIVWCPLAYLRLGISAETRCRIPELYRSRVNVALGVDGAIDATIGDTGPAAFLVAANAGDQISPGNVLEMQTICAAKVAGLGELIGSVEPGKRADIVIRTQGAAEVHPGVNPVHQLALTSRASTVDTVIINGEIVFRNGHSTRVDESEVYTVAKASVERRLARLGLSVRIEWPVVS